MIELNYVRCNGYRCEKCGRQTEELYLASLNYNGKTNNCILCRECLENMKNNVGMKNSELDSSIDMFFKKESENRSISYCKNCGFGNSPNSNFCAKCGSRMNDVAYTEAREISTPVKENEITAVRKENEIAAVKEEKDHGLAILTFIMVFIFVGFFAAFFYFQFFRPNGSTDCDSALDSYIESAYSQNKTGDKALNMTNEEYMEAKASSLGKTLEEFQEDFNTVRKDYFDDITGYTFSTVNKPNAVEKDVTLLETWELEQWNEEFRECGLSMTASEGIRADIGMNYLLNMSISGPEVTDYVVLLRIEERWYVFDSGFISDMMQPSEVSE